MAKANQANKKGSGTALPPGVELRNGILTYRKRWPARVLAVRPDLKGRDWAKSLGTSDPKAIAGSYASAVSEFLRKCDEHVAPKPPKLPESSAEWIELLPDAESDAAMETIWRLAEAEMAKGYAHVLHPMVERLLPEDAKARIVETVRSELAAVVRPDVSSLREAGFPDELPVVPAEVPLPWETLLDAWKAEAQPSAATVKKYSATFRSITKILGFDDLRKLTADDAIKFKEARLKAGTGVGTIEDDIRAAGGVCKWAVKNRKLAANPFDGTAPKAIHRAQTEEEGRAPYTEAEAKAILSHARNAKGWLRWGSWLLAFSGARPSEFTDMRRGDVREEDGVPIFDFKAIVVRRGKNPIFQRMVPIHPAIIAEGFLEYVKGLPDDPKGPLFPDITADKHGKRAVNGTASMSRWIHGKVKISDPTKAPSYSWRHRIQDELRRIDASDEIVDAITGRNNPRNAGAGYGKGFRRMPAKVLEVLERIPSPV